MENEGNKRADKALANLERSIKGLYKSTKRELQKEIEAYFEQFKEADEKKRVALNAGEITKEQYKQWRIRQIATGIGYEELRDKIARQYLATNREAIELVNASRLDVFAENYNFEAYILESAVNGDEIYSQL